MGKLYYNCIRITVFRMTTTRKAIILSAVLLLISCYQASCQYKYLTTKEGLASNTIRSICQDRQGFIWAGTEFGLCKCFGNHFNRVVIDASNENEGIRAICPAPDMDILFVNTNTGLFSVDIETEAVTKIDIDQMPFITCMRSDTNGNLWMGTNTGAILRYNRPTGSFHTYTTASSTIEDILISSTHDIWCLGQGQILFKFNSSSDRFDSYSIFDKYTRRELNNGKKICEDVYGSLWIADNSANLFCVSTSNMDSICYEMAKGSEYINVRTLLEYSPGVLLLGTNSGLLEFNTDTRKYKWRDKGQNEHPGTLNDRFIHATLKDRDGGLWIGTYFGGVNYLSSNTALIKTIYPSENCGKIISVLEEIPGGKVMIGSDDRGLSLYDTNTGDYSRIVIDKSNVNLNIHSILIDDETVWVGTYGNGLYRIGRGGTIKNFLDSDVEGGDLNTYSTMIDSGGRLWIGTRSGICIYNKENESINQIYSTGRNSDVTSIMEWGSSIYFAAQNGGIVRYDKASDVFSNLSATCKEAPASANNIEAYNGNLYFGTNTGLYVLTGKGAVEQVETDLEKTCRIYGMVGDYSGLWMTTNEGLICLDENGRVSRFNVEDGLINEEFSLNSMAKLSSGDILLGTAGGLNSFKPTLLKNSPRPQNLKVIISGIDKYDREGTCFSVGFTALNYQSQEKNIYRYRLSGYEKDWHMASTHEIKNGVRYIHVKPGRYQFEVSAASSSNDKFGEESKMEISVSKSPERKKIEASVSGLLLILVTALIWQVCSNIRNKRRMKAGMKSIISNAMMKSILEDTMMEVRETLQTNILASKIQTTPFISRSLKEEFNAYERNYQKINEFIENKITEIESCTFSIRDSGRVFDVIRLVSALCEEYSKLAHDYYDITIDLSIDEKTKGDKLISDSIHSMYATAKAIESGLNNASRNISVRIASEGKTATIRVENDRKGKHHVSESASFNLLRFELPEDNSSKEIIGEFSFQSHNIIIAETRSEIHPQECEFEGAKYNIVQCRSTDSIIESAERHIISSVVFNSDSIEDFEPDLISRLKESHPEIIRIILGPSSNDKEQIEALRTGLATYIRQPAGIRLIIAQIHNLRNFKAEGKFVDDSRVKTYRSMAELCQNDKFAEQIYEIIQKNISNPDLSIDTLAGETRISRASVFNKIKAATNLTPNSLVNKIRLEKATELLCNPEMRISEICYSVGFASGSYFSKLFREEYGVTPKEYAKSRR